MAFGGVGFAAGAAFVRPCQFEALAAQGCEPAVWTSRRYGPANLSLMSKALSELKREHEELLLIGFSGGGVMAALLAATRDDVRGLITIAANLDTRAWTQHHRVSPLTGSLNPASFGRRLAAVPQVHLAGGADPVVAPGILKAYLDAIGLPAAGHSLLRPTFDHSCCWVDDWETLEGTAMQRLQKQVRAGKAASR